ncbi:unnamed protein product, partial [Meganyctiphanes norvegica]
MASKCQNVEKRMLKKMTFELGCSTQMKKTYCDATIACEGNFYPVHRFVLSTCSTYFESVLENVSDSHPVIVLADLKSKDIEDLLQYMYTGEVKVLQEDIDSLIKVGETLKIKGLGVADENENPKKNKRAFNDNEERSEKRQRTDETSKKSKNSKEAKSSSEDCNEDANQKEMDGAFDSSVQQITDFLAVKQEIFLPSEEFHEHDIKEEVRGNLMEEDLLSAESEKYEGTSDTYIEQEYDTYETLTNNSFNDASTSSMSPAQKMHMDWIRQNEFQGQAQENRRMPLTGYCLVCGDGASGYHYGIETCEGCKAFFKRSTRNNSGMSYGCNYGGECDISRANRGTCKACRFKKCLNSGMKVDNISMQPGSHFPQKIGLMANGKDWKRRDCLVCKKQTARPLNSLKISINRSSYICKLCEVPLCIEPCFEVWHTMEDFEDFQMKENAKQLQEMPTVVVGQFEVDVAINE